MYFYVKRSRSSDVIQLLESYRDAAGRATNRVVVSLGNAKIPKALRDGIAASVEAKLYGQLELFPPAEETAYWVDQIVKKVERQGRWLPLADKAIGQGEIDPDWGDSEIVDGVLIDGIQHAHETTLGPELVGLHAWKQLKMDPLLAALGFNPAQAMAATVSVINRLVAPVSEHGLLKWLPTSSLADLLGEDVYRGEDRYYRVSDKLLAHQEAIETHLRNAVAIHFGFQRAVVLYDLTNTHFEGVCLLNDKAKRGANKQKRNDCPQIVVAIGFDEHGFVLFHKTFPGNTADSPTLAIILQDLEKRAETADGLPSGTKPLLIMDAGMASSENRALLRRKKYRYLVNETRARRKQYAAAFAETEKFAAIPGRKESQTVTIRVLEEKSQDAESEETVRERVILCHSATRAAKEQAILSGAERRFVNDLETLGRGISSGRLKDAEKIDRKIGAVAARHPRVSRYYEVKIDNDANGAHLRWTRKDHLYEPAEALTGSYILRTNNVDLKGDELWNLYITLTTAEAGFKALKSDLGMRPIFHQTAERSDAHILITVLAYQLQRFITYTLSLRGDRRCWQTLRRVLQTHCYATLLVPTRDGRLYRIRKAGLAEECQREIYRHLGVECCRLPTTKIVVRR